jgi:hypothetical protein
MNFNTLLNKQRKHLLAPNSHLGKTVIPTKLEQSSNLATRTGFVIISAGLS